MELLATIGAGLLSEACQTMLCNASAITSPSARRHALVAAQSQALACNFMMVNTRISPFNHCMWLTGKITPTLWARFRTMHKELCGNVCSMLQVLGSAT